ncbi:MAG: zinc-dependent metalloprotease [Vulcanimicrobiaceae bacterium]
MRLSFLRAALLLVATVTFGPMAVAAQAPKPTTSSPASPGSPMPYAVFVKGAKVLPGLIPIVRKAGNVYFALAKTQIGQDFIETSVPSTGLGGFGPAAGEPYVAPARIMRFERVGNMIVMRWPNTYAKVRTGSPRAKAARQSLPSSVIAVVPIIAQDASNGTVLIPAAPFLGDVADYAAVFQAEIKNPMHGYHLDPSRTFFSQTKAFPKNDTLRVDQTWASFDPTLIDNAPDARSLEVKMTYNIIALPHDHYMPRIADPRVGFFEQPLLDFAHDRYVTRNLYYISRWNFAPATPGKPSKATRPLVFYMSNDIPREYRQTVKDALMTWNNAFEKVGILDAVQVKQQPTTPGWDPADIRHNMVRWVDTTNPQFGAEALITTDPRTGQEINVGVDVDAIMGMTRRIYRFVVAPARGLPDSPALEKKFALQYLRATVLHESGHTLGLQHNFIGSYAYTAQDLQSKKFTNKFGIATSVMEYAPVNLWPKGTKQGDYVQLVLGPYDYYAIHYGYGYVPNAKTARQELPTLRRWASKWDNPLYRFASDEDVEFFNGHAIDPRVAQFDLTNHPLAWCGVQMKMMHGLMNAVNARFPAQGRSYQEARMAFLEPLYYYTRCAVMPAHTIGGEYLSRADKGEKGSGLPLQAVPRAQEYRAWQLLARGLFADRAWHYNPLVLRSLIYNEVSSFTGGMWAYNPPNHHGVDIAKMAAAAQDMALDEVFAPITLQRIDTLSMKYPRGSTMSLSDLFNWAQSSIYGDLANGGIAKAGVIRRSLQIRYANRLAGMWLMPFPGTPTDAQAMARLQLIKLADVASAGLHRGRIDSMTRAHLEALMAIAKQALEARASVAAPSPLGRLLP